MKRAVTLILCAFILTSCHAAAEPDKSEPGTSLSDVSVCSMFPKESALPDDNASAPEIAEPENDAPVDISIYIPRIAVDLKYASADNFTGERIYSFDKAFLRYGTAMKLKKAQSLLSELGLTLVVWDAFRPISAQQRFWEICSDPTYVADPSKGVSKHSRGSAVDLTLADTDGAELEMPSGFDDFSSRADRDYSDVSVQAAENAKLLERIMTECGFNAYSGEWWHYTDTDNYPPLTDESFINN